MKQGHQRVSTNQTSISNKKSSKSKMQSNNNKNADNIHSQSFQLPKIHRGSNNDVTSNRSYDLFLTPQQKLPLNHHHRLSNIEQSDDKQQTIGVIDYQKMTMQQIKREYERLRKEFNILNLQIRRSQQTLLSRVTNKKSRVSSTGETQKLLAKTEMEVYENSLLLQKLRLQSQQLDKRTNLANSNISKPNAQLNEKLVKVKQKLLSTKQKIKLLRKKTKKSGEDILNVQDVHELAQKLQKENKNYELKLSSLQAKLQESKYKIERQDQKLLQIHNSYNEAQNYLKLFKLQNEQQAERGIVEKQYQQLKYKHQVIKKKIQSDQQTNLQKYHQLLKLLQIQNEKQESLSKKLIQEDVNILKARNVMLELEQQLQQLEGIITKFKQQQLMKKQASLLRKAIESGTSMTDTNSIVPSPIIEQNESQLNDTIEAVQKNETISYGANDYKEDEKSDNESVQLRSNKIRYGGKRVQDSNQIIKGSNNSNSVNMRVNGNSNEQIVSQKQLAKRRNEQFKGSIISSNIKKQQTPSNTDVKSGRKIHSVMQTKPQSYLNANLKQTDLSNNENNAIGNVNNRQSQNQGGSESKMPSIGQLQQRSSSKMSMVNKQPMKNRNNNKSSLKNNNDDVNDEFIHQLEKLNQELIQPSADNTNQQQINVKTSKQINTKASQQSQAITSSQQSNTITSKQKISPRLQHSIVSPKSRAQSINKQSRIKKQHSKILKPQMLQQIDKSNIEYSKKISQLRKQIKVGQITNAHNKEDKDNIQQQQQQQHQQPTYNTTNPIIQQSQQQHHKQQQKHSIPSSDSDLDIDNDIQQINNMVRKRLENIQTK